MSALTTSQVRLTDNTGRRLFSAEQEIQAARVK